MSRAMKLDWRVVPCFLFYPVNNPSQDITKHKNLKQKEDQKRAEEFFKKEGFKGTLV